MDQIQGSKGNLSAAKRALLAQRLKGLKGKKAAEEKIIKRPFTDAPLSFSQERFWFMNQLHPESGIYNIHEALELTGPLNVAALEKALTFILQHHESLRANFREEDGQIIQTIRDSEPAHIPITDLSNLDTLAQEDRATALATDEAKRPFNLQNDPLLRFSLLKLSPSHHWVLLTIHHIVADEWSINLFWKSLNTAYTTLCQEQQPAIDALPIQYPDFAYWQKEQFAQSKLDKQFNYWQKTLSGELPLLQLPTDRPRPVQQTFVGGFEQLTLSQTLKEKLNKLAQAHGASLFMVLMAAYKALLYRYTQQTDLLVGTPIANRARPETKQLIGLFLNSVVVRTQLDPEASFTTYLEQVKQMALDVYANQEYPFEKLVEKLQPNRDQSHNPIFQTMFVYQSAGENGRSLHNHAIKSVPIDGGVAKFDMTLFMMEREDGLGAAFEYNSDLFDQSTIQRLLQHWHTLLHSIAENPAEPIYRLNILPKAEHQLVVNDWNNTAVSYPKETLVHQLIEQVAEQTPLKTAVQSESSQLTYQQLNEKANQLAHYLIEQGVQPNDIVGLKINRSLEMAIGILGILKAGGAYLPLDPGYPEDRLTFMQEDASVSLTVDKQQLSNENWDERYSQYPLTNPNSSIQPDQLAYVIYTSGSTGKPKGVLVTHQNIVHSTTARFSFYTDSVEKFLLLSSFSFDSSMVGIFWSLCQGGTLCLPNQGDEKDIKRIAELINQLGITHLLALPTLYTLLLEETAVSQLGTLKTVIVAGEACPKSLVSIHYGNLPNTQLYNEYGPTEGTVWSTACLIPEAVESTNVPIGIPIPNMQNFILDPHQQPVPIGVPGELVIGGEGITRGYLNRPDLTSARFISLQLNSEQANDSENKTSARYYRTGDLVRWLPDGQIEFLGRLDHQIKIRGFRVELGEIETAVKAQPHVQEVVVYAIGEGSKQLACYLTASQPDLETVVRNALTQTMPDYMVPTYLMQLAEMPRTPNGKVDRQSLPNPKELGQEKRPFAAPQTETETKLATLWETVLELEKVGVEDNFFNLGGHSLLATKLIARTHSLFEVRLPIQTIFEAPTIRQMAKTIEEKKTTVQSPNGIPTIKRAARRVRRNR
ncbi:MAG: amino acid adenylation domain-containing protein [Chloroflexota bacterium]